MRKKYTKLFIGSSDVDCDKNVKKNIIFSIAAKTADDNKDNYVLVKEKLRSFSVISTTYEDKNMKDSWHVQKGN